METEIVDIKTASALTGLAVQTLRNLRCHNEGPRSFTLRGRVRYYRSDISEWIADEAGRTNVTPIRRAG